MTTKNDGGPAFPDTWFVSDDSGRVLSRTHQEGMTLRDYFAAQIIGYLYTVLSSSQTPLAVTAYELADEMLEARLRRDTD